MASESKHLYEFGPFRLDLVKRVLFREGKRVPLGSKAMDTLLVLVEKAGQTVQKDELMKRVWQDTAVEENNLNQSISSLRKALGDSLGEPQYVATVPGQGYRFVAPIKTVSDQSKWKAWSGRRALAISLALVLIGLGSAVALIWPRLNREKLSTRSPEARMLYLKATDYERKGDDEEALSALRQALTVDPHFVEAYLEAASVYQDMGENGRALEMAKSAERLSASVKEPVKLRLKGLLYELESNPEKALETYQLLLDLYPRDAEGHLNFAAVAMQEGRLDEASRSLQACLEIDSTNPFCNYLRMFLELRSNQFDAVLSSYDSLRSRDIEYPWFDEPVGIAFWAKDQIDKAMAHLQSLSAAHVGAVRLHGAVHLQTAEEWTADIDLYQGKVAEGKRLVEQLLDAAQSSDVKAEYLIYLARIEAFVGDRATAKSRSAEALAVSKDPATLLEGAEVLAMVGAKNDAMKALSQWRVALSTQGSTLELSEGHFVRGAVALANGQLRDAIEELPLASKSRENLEAQFLLAHAYMADGQWAGAAKLLSRIIQAKGTILLDYLPSLWPLAHYDLARCYEQLGQQKEALANYSRFLELWNAADPGIKEIVQAKKRVAALSEEVRGLENRYGRE